MANASRYLWRKWIPNDKKRIGHFEIADGGTLFLDEIDDLPLATQAKLLRVIQEREFERVGGSETIKVDIRLITATKMDLEKAMKEGEFREDLYYQINVVPIILTPLRERKEDIPLLANYFLDKYRKQINPRVKEISPEALKGLEEERTPSRVRLLKIQVIEGGQKKIDLTIPMVLADLALQAIPAEEQ